MASSRLSRGREKSKNVPELSGSALSGKKIVVTGGAGFLGLPVVRTLVDRGVRPRDIFIPRSS